jgi:hypothetical protein
MSGIDNPEASQHRFVYVGDGWNGAMWGFTPHIVRGRICSRDAAVQSDPTPYDFT